MQVPSIFYGSYRDVRKATKPLAQAFIEGVPVEALVEAAVETQALPGVLILDEPHAVLCSGPHFFFETVASWLLKLQGRVESKAWTRFYEWALSQPGNFPAVLGQMSVAYMFDDPRYQSRFIQAGLRFWNELAAEGPRYVMRGSPGVSQDLWTVPNGIKRAMVALSGRSDWVFDPLPPGGLAELVERLGLELDKPQELRSKQ